MGTSGIPGLTKTYCLTSENCDCEPAALTRSPGGLHAGPWWLPRATGWHRSQGHSFCLGGGEVRACARAQSSGNSREFCTELFLSSPSSDLEGNYSQLWVPIVTLKQLIPVLATNSLLFGGPVLAGVPCFSSLSPILSPGALFTLLETLFTLSSSAPVWPVSPVIPSSPLSSLWPQRPLRGSPSFWTLSSSPFLASACSLIPRS